MTDTQPLYSPSFTPIQVRMWNCPKKRQIDIAAQRSGKTYEIMMEHLDYAIRVPGHKGCYVGPTFTLIAPLGDLITEFLYDHKMFASQDKQNHIWRTLNGGMIQFKSAENPETIRSMDYDFVTLDEASLCSEIAYHNCEIAVGVLDGTLRIASNVPEPHQPGYSWVTEVFHKWSEVNECEARVFASWENCVVYPKGRHDPKILQLERDLPPDVFQRRIAGNMRVLTGVVYPEFDPAKHVIADIMPGKCAVSIDPAYKNVASIHWYDFDGHRLTAFDEVYRSHLTDPDIVAIVAGYPICPEFAVYDAEDAGLGAMLIEAGIPAIPADKRSVHEGIMVTKTWFHQGRVRICRRCEKLRWELSKYAFHKNSETPIKVNDHACDDLRYMVTQLDNSEKRQAEQAIHIREELPRIELGQEPSHVWA